jgi:DNA topoisomerase VI subunit B
LEIFNIGGQKLKKSVDDLWKKIAEWFKKNKKLLLYEGPGSKIRSALAKVVDIASDLAPLVMVGISSDHDYYIISLFYLLIKTLS